jgi:hypothetical protein
LPRPIPNQTGEALGWADVLSFRRSWPTASPLPHVLIRLIRDGLAKSVRISKIGGCPMSTDDLSPLESMDKFVHTLAFELRTDASLVLGYSQMLKEFSLTNQDQEDTLDKMQNLSARLMEQQNNFLNLWESEREKLSESVSNFINHMKPVEEYEMRAHYFCSSALRPIMFIVAYAEMMLEGLIGDLNQDQTESLKSILRHAEILKQQITSFLADISTIFPDDRN